VVNTWYPQLAHQQYILAVSSIAAHKNYETLLSAFALLPREHLKQPLSLAIAGATSNANVFRALQQQADELGIADRVHFLGRVAYDRLPALYCHATMFTFPSRLESFGAPLLEAMASGTPIVASKLPAFEELAGPAAEYFPPTDATSCADRMEAVLLSPTVQQRLREQGRQRAQTFSWQQAAEQILNIFDEVV
jgi:glycosyltransferase involved in cell wall biosynthesis